MFLLEKLIVTQPVIKVPDFKGNTKVNNNVHILHHWVIS
jgi:hypothetical protein